MKDEFHPVVYNYKKDVYILIEGMERADVFYIIQQGQVRISRDLDIQGSKGEILDQGDYFGFISALSGHSQVETAQALTDVTVIAIQKHQYPAFIKKNPHAAIKILKHFSKRLRFLNKTLAKITLKNNSDFAPSDFGTTHLFNVAEYYHSQGQNTLAAYAYTKYLTHCPQGKCAAMAKERIEEIKRSVNGKINFDFSDNNSMNRDYDKNTMLFAEGEPGEECFVVQSGSIKIVKIADYKEVLLAVLKHGDIVGEMALLEGKPRDACAIAFEDCSVIAVNKNNFEFIINSQPQLIAKIITLLAERIWLMYKQLANTLLDDPLHRIYDALSIQLERNKVRLNSKDPYTFSFGQPELLNMAGLSFHDGKLVLDKLFSSKKIRVVNDKIQVVSVMDLVKQNKYYKKMDKIKKNE